MAPGETHYNGNGDAVTAGQAGFVDEAFGFTGRYFDSDTELQNNLNRWYDPAIGRWLSEDPIGFAAGDPNLYRYVGNSPTMYVDPNGLHYPAEYPYPGTSRPSPDLSSPGPMPGHIVNEGPFVPSPPAGVGDSPSPTWPLPGPPNDIDGDGDYDVHDAILGPPPSPPFGLPSRPPSDEVSIGAPSPYSMPECPPPRNFLDALAEEIKQIEKADDMHNTAQAFEEYNRDRGNPWRDRIREINSRPALR